MAASYSNLKQAQQVPLAELELRELYLQDLVACNATSYTAGTDLITSPNR